MEKKKLAETFSLVLQPSAIAVLLYLVVSFSFATGWRAWFFFLIGLLFVGIFPILLVIFLTKKGKVSDPDLPNREERFFSLFNDLWSLPFSSGYFPSYFCTFTSCSHYLLLSGSNLCGSNCFSFLED